MPFRLLCFLALGALDLAACRTGAPPAPAPEPPEASSAVPGPLPAAGLLEAERAALALARLRLERLEPTAQQGRFGQELTREIRARLAR